MTLRDQPTRKPTRKVGAGAATGGAAATLIWAVRAVFGVEVPAEVAAYAVAVVSSLVAYLVRNRA